MIPGSRQSDAFRGALRGREKALGAEHTSKLDTVNNLGILYRDQGKLAEAEEMYMRALRGQEKALGAEHTSTLTTVICLGMLRVNQNRVQEAKDFYNRANAGYSHMSPYLQACVNSLHRMILDAIGTDNIDKFCDCASRSPSLFNSLYRSEALVWYTATNYSQNIADVTIWQMSCSKDAYLRLPVQYRPTGLQLTESYPSVIDWCPFPTIRDRLILLHAANPLIDDIVCEIATAYVVEVDAAELVQQAVGRGYVRVWDLVHASPKPSTSLCQRNAARPGGFAETTANTLSSHLPAASIEQLFTRQPASAAFKLLGLGDGIPRFKLDPSFFAKYPELYDTEVDIVASGTPIAPAWQTSIPTPTPPAMETRHIYWHSVDWTLSALSRGVGILPMV